MDLRGFLRCFNIEHWIKSIEAIAFATEDALRDCCRKTAYACASAATAVGGVGSACLAPFSGYQAAKPQAQWHPVVLSCADSNKRNPFFRSCVTADTIHLNTVSCHDSNLHTLRTNIVAQIQPRQLLALP